ncbi:Methyltransferase domain-containing protein [Candidatus Hepatincolaceae symbiont of Richtersius coronifer]
MKIFDRELLKSRKNTIAKNVGEFSFLRKEVVSRLLERTGEINKDFPLVLDIGCNLGEVSEYFYNNIIKNKINRIIQTDLSLEILKLNKYPNKINGDEENLPFKPNTFDLIISVFSLQNVNFLKETLENIFAILKPQGLFMCSVPIVGTLSNLEQALMQTEMSLYNGMSPRIHPFSDIKTLGNLFQSAGFAEIMADKDQIEVMYKDFFNIFRDLQGYGENNILLQRNQRPLKKHFFQELKNNFKQFKDSTTDHYPINVEFCNILGWKNK